jgi:hypothetical protein
MTTKQDSRRKKTDWAGIQMGDCFKYGLDIYIRYAAKKIFYRYLNQVIQKITKISGVKAGNSSNPKVKAQITPFFTNFPSQLAAYASIGLTVFLEYQKILHNDALHNMIKSGIERCAKNNSLALDKRHLENVYRIVFDAVYTRFCLAELSQNYSFQEIEIYRLFAASQVDTSFPTVSGIIRTVILYGDVIIWQDFKLHFMAKAIAEDVFRASIYFFEIIEKKRVNENYYKLTTEWANCIMNKILWFIPYEKEFFYSMEPPVTKNRLYRYRKNSNESFKEEFAPLNESAPPALEEPVSSIEKTAHSFGNTNQQNGAAKSGQSENPNVKKFTELLDSLDKASGQESQWQNKRSDLIEQDLKDFKQGEIEGDLNEGNRIEMKLKNQDRPVEGEIYDVPIEPVDDITLVEALIADAQPLIQEMQKQLYPNLQEAPVTEKMKTSGSLDPTRLANAFTSEAFFRRYRIEEQLDKRGRPVLLIITDGSGSMSYLQTRMLKLLTTAWLESTKKMEIQILACIYNQDRVRSGLTAALIRWIYHPQKSLTNSKEDALRAVAALPDYGNGSQCDALSLAFALQEAKKLAQNRMIYVIHMTDCGFIKSFNTHQTAKEEVYSMYKSLYEELDTKLHVTLVGFNQERTGFEDLLDKVIPISTDELSDTAKVAQKIGVYIANTMRERKKMMDRGK